MIVTKTTFSQPDTVISRGDRTFIAKKIFAHPKTTNRADGGPPIYSDEEIAAMLKLSYEQAKRGETFSAEAVREMIRAEYGI